MSVPSSAGLVQQGEGLTALVHQPLSQPFLRPALSFNKKSMLTTRL